MILKSFVVFFVSSYITVECTDYTYDPSIEAWLKLYEPASWDEAFTQCDSEGAVLATPINIEIRNAIRDYVAREGMPGSTILTGIQADYETGDYYSIEGVPLVKMPVIVDSSPPTDFKCSESCLNWMTSEDEVTVMKCTDKNPFVCLKKKTTMVVAGCGTSGVEYKYNQLAGGWLKYHEKASWEEAFKQCDAEGAVLASPINSQIRDGIQYYLNRILKPGATIHTGVRATPETGDFYSREGVDLKKMPVLIATGSVKSDSQSCVKWMTGKAEVMYKSCQEEIPFVCFKKRKNLAIAGCGTLDPEYSYSDKTGSCYKVHTKSLNWSKASKQCEEEGGHLAICNNQLEKNVIVELNDKYPFSVKSGARYDMVFMGIYKKDAKGPWMTVKGQTLEESGFTGWGAGEPNSALGTEFCTSMFRDGGFNDEHCEYTLAYICEKKPEIIYS